VIARALWLETHPSAQQERPPSGATHSLTTAIETGPA
jgi:hypothetical protein